MNYLRNVWYMAAWSEELRIGQPLARTLLDEPVVLWRDDQGTPHALFDRCPHRFAPLSLGHFEGDTVTCRYHGLRFGSSGACVGNPHGPIARALSVRSYPMAEAHRALWIWMGDPAQADPARIRDLSFLASAPDTAFNSGYLHGAGHYQLFVDNILDLSHTDYLHPTTLGGGSITRTPGTVEQRPDGIIAMHWHPKNEVPIPLLAPRLPPGVDRVDSWTEVEWSAPGVMKLVNGAVPAGTPRSNGGNSINVHIMTPETASTTHYFFASTRDFLLDDAEYNEQTRRMRAHIFSTEDEPMIAAQQSRIGAADFWSLAPALLKIDKGAVMVRRRMDELIAAEARETARP
ncbi:MAG TPA: aromatic ring-hydroxylating dioxygenase subunit alpha [Povalibacter sp.]|uniref:aromatic ring-hydroxylating dioxygenase subunit alpha n=1 Tax=Povalibacter sp. TaxID=1962978 RepID=UPI002BA0515F|nr:aromatic ring-hydroxylating dioxygenase subunit alpha [Povalibacter sp.]HMN43020.1 aromatic ring-hydroxylating dioxygenase subunit alpha [Povalibacter sp.]